MSPIHSEFGQLLLYVLASSDGCGLHHEMLLSSAHAHCTNWHSDCILVVFSHIIPCL